MKILPALRRSCSTSAGLFGISSPNCPLWQIGHGNWRMFAYNVALYFWCSNAKIWWLTACGAWFSPSSIVLDSGASFCGFSTILVKNSSKTPISIYKIDFIEDYTFFIIFYYRYGGWLGVVWGSSFSTRSEHLKIRSHWLCCCCCCCYVVL